MRCYKVKVTEHGEVVGFRYAPTQGAARLLRRECVHLFQVSLKDVDVLEHEVPTRKEELLDYLNALATKLDNASIDVEGH